MKSTTTPWGWVALTLLALAVIAYVATPSRHFPETLATSSSSR